MDMARRTLESSRNDLTSGDYNWACFKAQQSAEFALKGLLRGLGLNTRGQSLTKLLLRLPENLNPAGILEAAKSLDQYYLPTRYPDSWAEGAPADFYTKQDARKAISHASLVIKWVEETWLSIKAEKISRL